MMTDTVDKKTRSRIMSTVHSKDTKVELLVRKSLFKRGYRFRLYDERIYGRPDIILKKFNVVIFINGCFWHQHDCPKAKLPSTNYEFWFKKLSDNKKRDKKNIGLLLDTNWRVCIIWECSINKKNNFEDNVINSLINFLHSEEKYLELGDIQYD